MNLLPEWAPNLHPLIVHFPLALLFVAVMADAVALATRRWSWLRPATLALYVAGALAAIVTYFTGTWAADSIGAVPAAAESVLTEHADWGWWTMWFFGVYAPVRLLVWRMMEGRESRMVEAALFAVALGGLVVLWQTGEHGAQLVYQHGVGVQATSTQEGMSSQAVEPGLMRTQGGWTWQPTSAVAWTNRVQWMGNPSSSLKTKMVALGGGAGEALQLRLAQGPLMFVVPDTLGSTQTTAELNVEAFDGAVMLVHHVQNDQTYDFLAVEDSTVRIGRVQQGNRTVLDEAQFEPSGWLTVRVTGDGTHFRGYVGGQMVVHGHAEALAPGPVGMRFEGQGRVLIRRVQVRSLGQ